MKNENQQFKIMDIHTHILPGVDDGAKDMQEALSLVRQALENSTRAIVLTPHYRAPHKMEADLIYKRFCLFRKAVHKEMPQMQVYLGCEIRYQDGIPQMLKEHKLLPMYHSRYILLEFTSTAFSSQILSAARECVGHGFIPIIAHIERCDAFRNDPQLLSQMQGLGVLLQMNADSVMGKMGLRIKKFCQKMLETKQVHFIASDAHDATHRPPLLKECYAHVSEKYGAEYAKKLFWENPQAVVKNEDI